MASRISLILAFVFITNLGFSQAADNAITFIIKNAGIGVDGFFEESSVNYKFYPNDLNASFFKLTIPTTTINTGIKARDKHLRKSKYFDVEEYPNLTFNSTRVVKTTEGYKLLGDLSMKATTLPIEILFTIEEVEGKKYFIGNTELDRRDYDVGKNHLILGDLVKINIKILYSEN